MNFDRGRHPLLQIFFTVFSVLFMVVDVFTVQVILEINGITQLQPLMETLLTTMIYGGLVFFMFYIGLTYAITYLRKRLARQEAEREGNFGEGGLSK